VVDVPAAQPQPPGPRDPAPATDYVGHPAQRPRAGAREQRYQEAPAGFSCTPRNALIGARDGLRHGRRRSMHMERAAERFRQAGSALKTAEQGAATSVLLATSGCWRGSAGVTERRCGFPEDSPAGGHHSSSGPDRSRLPAADRRSRSAGSR
jgi:hypothetical protein